jgi:MYXO-CTERM domain-containing protein
VLFDMNGDNYYQTAGVINDPSSDDNATVALTFTQSGMPSVNTIPIAFDDPNVLDGSAGFVNSNMARYGQSDPIRAFALEGGGVVPEPSTAILGLLGLAAVMARPRRRSKE